MLSRYPKKLFIIFGAKNVTVGGQLRIRRKNQKSCIVPGAG